MPSPSGQLLGDVPAIINNLMYSCTSDPFHALVRTCISSSWLSKVISFRQETYQLHYRNDPVKYNLDDFHRKA